MKLETFKVSRPNKEELKQQKMKLILESFLDMYLAQFSGGTSPSFRAAPKLVEEASKRELLPASKKSVTVAITF